MKTSPRLPVFAAIFALALSAMAQVPDTLKYSITGPATYVPPVQSKTHFGWSVAVNGSYTVVGEPGDAIPGRAGLGSVAVFDTVSGAELLVLTQPAPTSESGFGTSVAISGTLAVVGAPDDYGPGGSAQVGSAYVFDLVSATPTVPVAILHNPSPASGNQFGSVVAISGTRVVVGALNKIVEGVQVGGAFVYDLSGATPTVPTVTLQNPNATSGGIAFSVGIDGTRVAVGSWNVNPGAPRVFVYDLTGVAPTVPILTYNDPGSDDDFGIAVAISGSHLVVGASADSFGAVDGHDPRFFAGSAYVYDLAGATPTVPMVKLPNPSPSSSAHFGALLAISGQRVAISVYDDDTGAMNAGSAYAYDLTSATPAVPVATFHNPKPTANCLFGVVGISGTRVVIGAPYDDTTSTDAGIAYGYDLAGVTPAAPVSTFTVPVRGPMPTPDQNFGQAVVLSGSRLIVGAYSTDRATPNVTGNVYVYDLAGATPTVPTLALQDPSGLQNDGFGFRVVASGSLVAVGANGVIYVYDLSGVTPVAPVFVLNTPDFIPGNYSGSIFSISGTRLTYGVSQGGPDGSGVAYVYDLAGATPTAPTLTLQNPTANPYDNFGVTVAIFGQRLVVGAPRAAGYTDDNGDIHRGIVYVYDLASSTPASPVINLYDPNPESEDYFGDGVAISGSRVVVGAYDYPDGDGDGIAYVFDLASPTTVNVGGTAVILPVVALQEPHPFYNQYFGYLITMSGSRVLFGLPGISSHADDVQHPGTAYLFDLASLTPKVPVLTVHSPQPGFPLDLFGTAIAIDGATLAVGMPDSSLAVPEGGAVFVYAAGAAGYEKLAATGGPVPGAGSDPRIPADAVWASFGVPAIDDSGAVAFFGKWKSRAGGAGAGIFGGAPTVLLTKAGDPAVDEAGVAFPGVAIKAFQDPVAAGGGVAFLATLSGTGVNAANKTALYYVAGTGGSRKLVAREGQAMPDMAGSMLNAIKSVAVDGGTVLFSGTLRIGPGGISGKDNNGAWRWQGIGTLATVVREGTVLAGVSASPVKSFQLLKAAAGSSDAGRGLWGGGVATFEAGFADGSSALVDATAGGATALYASGAATVPGVSGAKWKAFGPPATPGDVADGLAFLGTLKAGPGGATKRLFFQGASLASVALGDAAPGLPAGAKFSAFDDPVISPGSAAFAFTGTAKLGGPATTGIWWEPDGGALQDAVAFVGAAPPAPATGVTWSSFTSLAVTDRGPLFTARLAGAGSGNDTGLWAADRLGNVVQVLREGDPLDGKTIQNFTVLAAPSTAQGARRSYTGDGHVAVRVALTDGSSELIRIGLP